LQRSVAVATFFQIYFFRQHEKKFPWPVGSKTMGELRNFFGHKNKGQQGAARQQTLLTYGVGVIFRAQQRRTAGESLGCLVDLPYIKG
jgi:hypothetical protein